MQILKKIVVSVVSCALISAVTVTNALAENKEREYLVSDGRVTSNEPHYAQLATRQQQKEADAAKAQALANDPKAKAPKPDANGYYVGGPVYVSDKNRIWTRSGPSEGYRITGSRQIGDRMTFVRYSDNGRYAQLELDGNTFWMPLTALQPEICGYNKEADLVDTIKQLEYNLENYDNVLVQKLKEAESSLAKLTQENTELKAAVIEKEATIQELDEINRDYSDRLQTKELDMQMRWWMQGAIIAFSGAIVGVIFVFIPRPSRKQRRDRY